jgi:hypothetical protein
MVDALGLPAGQCLAEPLPIRAEQALQSAIAGWGVGRIEVGGQDRMLNCKAGCSRGPGASLSADGIAVRLGGYPAAWLAPAVSC